MFYLTCTMISSADLAHCGESRAKDRVSVDCGSKKLRGHIGLIMSVCPFVCYAVLRTRYLKNRSRYGVDTWYTVFLPYEDVLINF